MADNFLTQEQLDALVEAAKAETPERVRQRKEAQLKLGRLWDVGMVELDRNFNYVLPPKDHIP